MSSQVAFLLKKRTFFPLFLTQFFGAFNDNAFKLSMVTLISYHLSTSQAWSEYYQALAGALFTLPFFLFSTTAGQLADKYDKAILARSVKVLELILMCIGAYALYVGSIPLMMTVLTGMGIHSTFFGPIKYAILPDHLPREELLTATALIEASTFIAILLGTTLGALAIGSAKNHVGMAVFITNFVAVCGLVASLFIPSAKSKLQDLKIDWHLWRSAKIIIKDAMARHKVFPAMLAISWFWLIGAIMLTKLPDYIHYVLGASPSVFSIFLALFSTGIALGSMAINYLLAGNITLRYVPVCMLLLSVFATDLYFASPTLTIDENALQSLTTFLFQFSSLRIMLDFFLFSFCGGLFSVPLYTFIQVSCDDGSRARTLAANNILNALFMVLGMALVMLLLHFNVSIIMVFLILAAMNALAALGLWFMLARSA
ncbi:MFS transporter [Legionella sp. CNM-4043-24]|uniref:MFS transporter n=1 Tax=Legionella sp. CNM-4043-24 TaxID=3421646 RepID=UPI00403B0B4C